MASQFFNIRRTNPNQRYNEDRNLQSRVTNVLPGLLQNQLAQKNLARTEAQNLAQRAYWNRQTQLAEASQRFEQDKFKKQQKIEKRGQQLATGVKAAEFGMGLMSRLGGTTFGDIGNKVMGPGTYNTKSGFGGVSAGGAFGGGLMGLGAGLALNKGGLAGKVLLTGLGAGLGGFFG